MRIDVYTLAIVLGIIHAIQFVIFLTEFYYHKNYKGPGWWLLWSVTGLLGFIFLVTRQIKSVESISIFGQNLMLVLATVFIYIGIMRFLEKRERSNVLLIIFLIFIIPFSYYVFIDDNIHVRTILIWLTLGSVSFLSGYDLYLYRTKSIAIAANTCILVFLGHGIFAASKVILLLTGSEINHVDSPQFINTLSYIEALIITVFWTYALIMMINQRLTAEMERAKDHFEVIFHTTPDTILISSLSEGSITNVNDKFYDLSGYKPEEVLGKTIFDLNLWFDPVDRENYVSQIKEHGYCFDYEAVLQLKEGKKIVGLISGRIINLNEKLQLISIIRDISERKKREELTNQQNIQLQIINTEKDKFFSIIAHDLKGPFSTFLGLTEIMADKLPTLPIKEVIKLAGQMRDSARNLFGLLENLLQWSLIKRGMAKFNPEKIVLNSEIQESTLAYLDALQKKQISILLKVSENTMVYADKNMLRSLIRNLLSNAIKFTHEKGSVKVAAETLPDNSCLITVQDTGVGISKKMQDDLFKFNTNTSRKGTNGELSTGLGLVLCKEFVSMHNGELWVESKEGEGSAFNVKLPPGPSV